ncbi:MAG TPA: hypothetical protein VGN90_06215 [Pyrinomonadaceae bacterium]|nr:hypothetical protein [Pyrinomonadaceae bacterium]
MSDEKKLEHEGPEPSEQELKTRRNFLKSLGRWSAIIIGTAALGGLMPPEEAAGWVNGSVGWVNARGGWINGGRAYGGGGGAAWVNRATGTAGWVNRGGGWINGGGAGWVNRRGSWVNHH